MQEARRVQEASDVVRVRVGVRRQRTGMGRYVCLAIG